MPKARRRGRVGKRHGWLGHYRTILREVGFCQGRRRQWLRHVRAANGNTLIQADFRRGRQASDLDSALLLD
jgi:hypothetical protein